MAGLSNWEKLKAKLPGETMRYRDVYDDQQLDRTNMPQMKNMTSRKIATIAMSVFIFFITYIVLSVVQGYTKMVHTGHPAYLLQCFGLTFGKLFFTIVLTIVFYAIMYKIMEHNLEAQNALARTDDVNQYQNDQHIALPEEIQKNFDWFPDVGATSDVQFSSMISHMAISNKGLKTVQVAKRADSDILDDDGEVVLYKGEVLTDDDGNIIFEEKPLIDTDFMEALYDASGVPKGKFKGDKIRKYYNTTMIPYNPDGSNRDKLGKFDTVADLINSDWQLPYYEPQRPGGAYIVDTAPVNTMVLAITRAGKGQTVIEPTIDMWMRERRPNNMVINDPKGELLVKNYVRGTVRGFQIVQFNLINAMKTDIYNPLGLAADAAREGDFTKAALYVENIADVFFPLDGGEDPVWPNAANNAFKRAAYGLIDYYLEEEKELRRVAERTNMDEKILETKLDEMWGKVTLYNTYQLFVQLTSRKMKNPAVEFTKQAKAGAFDSLTDEEYSAKLAEVEQQAKLWEDKPEADMLTLYFNATDALPNNSMRRLVSNANNALRSMAGAEKMMASVYGIAITAMSFFTDPTISTLTSGTPSQNADLPGMSFPRCLGVRFHPDFLETYHLIGMQARWHSYADKDFKKELGKDFYHEDLVSREGWAKYYFKGKYERDIAYVKLEIVNPQTDMLIRTFYFQFRKSYQTSLDARYYIKDPVLGDKIVKNGVLIELRRFKKKDGTIVFKKAKTSFEQEKIVDVLSSTRKERVKTVAITQTMVRYSEKPKMVFLVTPPHLMKYAKLILILLKQLVDLNFDKSYMTKSNQKPLYKTRFMLDELGNLQSEGHGISGFETMLSIGLGQEQQFTLILQTLQQLRDVYGDSVDKIVQGNTSNIVFLKSTDDSMLDTLQKMSGVTHKTFIDSKTVTKDNERLFMQNKGEVTYTVSTKEVPVITYNDMAFISERNSIVFRAGDSPVWNRNETILPMSWRLFKNTIVHAGHEYSLQTIPTLSSALDFDVRKNQPDFNEMLSKRMAQANVSAEAQEKYKEAYNYSDYEMSRLDPDVYSDEIMVVINEKIRRRKAEENNISEDDYDGYIPDMVNDQFVPSDIEDNQEVIEATAKAQQEMAEWNRKLYAGKMLSKEDLFSKTSGPNHQFDADIIAVYREFRNDMSRDATYFVSKPKDKGLYGMSGEPYILEAKDTDLQKLYEEDAKDPNKRVYAGLDKESMTDEQKRQFEKEKENFSGFTVTDEFYKFLVSMDRWDFAHGRFDNEMARRIKNR